MATPQLGRYRLVQCVGTGGMGAVWAADDPELDRRVAVKLVLADDLGDAATSRARFIREMRALARVNHPHVLALFDCGTYDRDPVTGRVQAGVFMVTELVDGERLDAWLRRHPSADEIVEMIADVAHGLAAAHAAGLVHRDVKPANILVGRDGRPRVLDFGLARSPDAGGGATASRNSEVDLVVDDTLAVSASSSGAKPVSDDRITAADRVLGTPHYMAPEQSLGQPIDARTDQYALCLVLAEALLAEPVFPSSGAQRRLAAKLQGPGVTPPKGFAGTARLWRVIKRGLSPVAEDRWPDMNALLVALARARRPIWRPVSAIVATAAALAFFGVAAARTPDTSCALPEDLSAIWRPEIAERVAAALPADAAGPWAAASARIDGFARAWVEARAEVCIAPVVAPAETCLARSHDELASLVAALGEGSADTQQLERAAGMLSPPEACMDPSDDAASSLGLADRELVWQQERRAQALQRLGRVDAAADAAVAIVAAAEGGSSALQSYAWGRAAGYWRDAAQVERATGGFERAYHLANDAGAHEYAFDAASELARHFADAVHDPETAAVWLGHTEAALARMHEPPPRKRSRVHGLRATIAHARFDYGTEYAERERELAELQTDPDVTEDDLLFQRYELGHAATFVGRPADAIALLGPVAEVLARREGAQSPSVLIAQLNYADALVHGGRIADGLALLERIAEVADASSPVAVYARTGATEARWMLDGDADAAVAGYRAALAHAASLTHFSPREVALLHHRLGLVQAAAGRYEEAEAEQWAAITGIEAAAGGDAPLLRAPLEALVAARRARGRDVAELEARLAALSE